MLYDIIAIRGDNMDDEFKNNLQTKDDVLNMIVWIALDYDGCGDNAECLQKLVDELRELACYGRNLDE